MEVDTTTQDQPTDQVPVVLNGGSSNHGSMHHPIAMTPGNGSKFFHAGTKRDGHGVENGHRKATHSRRYPPSPFWDVDLSGPIYAFIGACFVVLVLTYLALEEVGRMRTKRSTAVEGEIEKMEMLTKPKSDSQVEAETPGFNYTLKIKPSFWTLPFVPGHRWAFVVPIFQEAVPSLTYAKAACVVFESARRTGTKAKHFVALVSAQRSLVPTESLLILEHCGAEVVQAGLPVPIELLNQTDPLYVQHLSSPGEAGVGFQEFHKLNVWRLTQFSSVIVLDADQFVNRNVDSLFRLKKKFSYSEGNYEKFNGGFFVTRPSMSAYMDMVHLLKIPGAYRKQMGWFGIGSTGFASGTLQGFLYYYWAFRRPALSLELDRCYWNRQIHWGTRNQKCWAVQCQEANFLHMISCPGKGAGRINKKYTKPYEVTADEVRYLLLNDYMGNLDPPLRSECLCALEVYLPVRDSTMEALYNKLVLTNKERPQLSLQNAIQAFPQHPTEKDLALTEFKPAPINKVAFLKTHKTGSTTLGNILFRYGMKHGLKFYTEGRHLLHCEEPVENSEDNGRADIVLHHVANFPLNREQFCFNALLAKNYSGATGFSRLMSWYQDTIPGAKLVTIFREPMSNYLSHFYFFYEPYHRSDPMKMEPDGYPLLRKYVAERKGADILTQELGLARSSGESVVANELHQFLDHEIEKIDVIILTDLFDLCLVVMRHTLGWDLDELMYLRLYDTKSGTLKNLIGRPLKKAPPIEDLDSETYERIKILTMSDKLIYEKAKSILMKRILLLENRGVDVVGESVRLKNMNNKLEKECGKTDLNRGSTAKIKSKCDLYSLKDVAYEALIGDGGDVPQASAWKGMLP